MLEVVGDMLFEPFPPYAFKFTAKGACVKDVFQWPHRGVCQQCQLSICHNTTMLSRHMRHILGSGRKHDDSLFVLFRYAAPSHTGDLLHVRQRLGACTEYGFFLVTGEENADVGVKISCNVSSPFTAVACLSCW